MDMFGLGTSVKKFEKKYLNSKETGLTIEDFERDHLRTMVHAYYLVQDLTRDSFQRFEQEAVAKADTPEGDEALMSAGFLVGVDDALHNPDIAFTIVSDMKRRQLQGLAHLIGDQSYTLVSSVECLCDYASARKLTPAQIFERFPRDQFEREFASYEKEHASEGA